MDNIPAYLEAENRYVFYLLVSQIKQWIQLFIMSQQEQQEFLWSETQFSSVTQSCPTLCNPINRSTPGLPVHHQFLEFT